MPHRTSKRPWPNKGSSIVMSIVALSGALTDILVALWRLGEKTPFGTLSELWQIISRTLAASLLSLLMVFVIAILWTLSRNSPVGKCIYKHKRVVCVFLVLAVMIPVPLLLFKGALPSLSAYAREILFSGVFLASASITLKVLTRVDQNKAREAEQLKSLEKWLREDDVTGWHELWEEVCFGDRLRSAVRLVIMRELQRVRQEKPGRQPWSGRNGRYEERLRLLLLSPSEVGKLSLSEPVPEKEITSRGYVHSDDFLSYVAAKAPSTA